VQQVLAEEVQQQDNLQAGSAVTGCCRLLRVHLHWCGRATGACIAASAAAGGAGAEAALDGGGACSAAAGAAAAATTVPPAALLLVCWAAASAQLLGVSTLVDDFASMACASDSSWFVP